MRYLCFKNKSTDHFLQVKLVIVDEEYFDGVSFQREAV